MFPFSATSLHYNPEKILYFLLHYIYGFSNQDFTYKAHDQFIKYQPLLQIKLLKVHEVVKIGFTLTWNIKHLFDNLLIILQVQIIDRKYYQQVNYDI